MPHIGRAPPMMLGSPTAWYHGSPRRLQFVKGGSTVTPVLELARAFSHKPTRVDVQIGRDGLVCLQHNGTRHGYLHRVLVEDAARDLVQHPDSGFACGEEVLTTRDLPVEFLAEVPV